MSYSFHDFSSSLSYLGAGSRHKTETLLRIAEQDTFFAPLAAWAKETTLPVIHRYWGAPGYYVPRTSADDSGTLYLSYRYGYSIAAHVFLHELVHAWQDKEGTLPTPYSLASTDSALQKEAIEAQYIASEIDAAMHAIAASWRLKKQGILAPWRGALAHKDWRKLTRKYYGLRTSGLEETGALEKLEEHWHTGRYVRFYQKQARKLTSKMAANASIAD